MNSSLKYSFFLFCALATISCSPQIKVTSDYDKSANFQHYHTFSLNRVEDASLQSVSELNQDRIYNAVRSEMTRKNFQESSNPDLIVHTATVLKDKQSVTATSNYYNYGGYYRPYIWGAGLGSAYTTYNVQNYKDGSLIINIVDAKTQKLIWEGVANKEIDKPSKDPDKDIATAVTSILAHFPPGGAKN